jgi:hypothetical protein
MRRLLLVLCAAIALGCASRGEGIRQPSAVRAAVSARVALGPGTEVRLADLTPFWWRRVYVFGPYTPLATIRDSLRLSSEAAAERVARGIQSRDDVDLLVFRFAHTAPQSMELPRQGGGFGPEVVGRGYGAEEAVFVVREPPPGSWGVLGPRP